MKEIIEIVAAWRKARQSGEEALLATVVEARGSTYRRAGARMLLTPSGWMAGSVSGGCLEGDILQKAWWRTEHGKPALVTYDSMDEDDIVWGFGLGCNGIVDVLLERLGADDSLNPVDFLGRCADSRCPGMLATVIGGSDVPGVATGQRLLLSGTEMQNSIGDPLLAHDILRDAQALLAEGQSEARTYSSVAGGIHVAFECALPPTPLVIFGAGHDAVPLAHFAKELGWHVSVVDTHSVTARAHRFPDADRVFSGSPEDAIRELAIDAHTAVVIMTHSYAQDSVLLPLLLRTEAAYLGILGPKKRTARLLDEITGSSLAAMEDASKRLHGPIGLDIGASAPEQIALAIVAEVQATLTGRTGGELRSRSAPIYADSAPKEYAHA